MATHFPSFRLAFAASALLIVTACGSSKNPDTLVGKNLDENAAMMDANASVDANIASANATQAESPTATATANHSEASNATAPANPAPRTAAAPKSPHSEHIDASDTETDNSTGPAVPEPDETNNQVDQPNAV